MNWGLVRDIAINVLAIVGALMTFAAGIGIARFPDMLSRMHAATKPQVLGLMCLLAAIGLQEGQWLLVPILVLIWLFQAATVPAAAHMVGRAGYRTRHVATSQLTHDDLEGVLTQARRSKPSGDAVSGGAGFPGQKRDGA